MERPLHGRLILVAEDEALVALDLKETLEDEEGAHVYLASTFREALNTVDHPKLCAAILDHSFRESDSSEVCARLKKRDIPFVIYSGTVTLPVPVKQASSFGSPPTSRKWWQP